MKRGRAAGCAVALACGLCATASWGADSAGGAPKEDSSHAPAAAQPTAAAMSATPVARDAAKEAAKEKEAARPDEKPKPKEAPAAPVAVGPLAAAPPADPAKEKSLADQIRDALGGRGQSTISLGKSAREKARESAEVEAHPPIRSAPKAEHAAERRSARAAQRAEHSMVRSERSLVREDRQWAYEGANGPQSWALLDPANAACAAGRRQSPIHIESQKTMAGPSDDLEFKYAMGKASVANNGHTFQVDVEEGSELVARGESYRLVQFHFHHPSEEKIDYRGFPMVAHMVHKAADGRLAVVAVELEVGAPNEAIARAWRSLPLDSGDKSGVGMGGIDPSWLLPPPGQRKYFQFMGSLTTPPCSEGVLWMVLKTPMTVSREQLALFTRFFPMNARPIQPDNGRLIREQE